jgi:hypothetical protein
MHGGEVWITLIDREGIVCVIAVDHGSSETQDANEGDEKWGEHDE